MALAKSIDQKFDRIKLCFSSKTKFFSIFGDEVVWCISYFMKQGLLTKSQVENLVITDEGDTSSGCSAYYGIRTTYKGDCPVIVFCEDNTKKVWNSEPKLRENYKTIENYIRSCAGHEVSHLVSVMNGDSVVDNLYHKDCWMKYYLQLRSRYSDKRFEDSGSIVTQFSKVELAEDIQKELIIS